MGLGQTVSQLLSISTAGLLPTSFFKGSGASASSSPIPLPQPPALADSQAKATNIVNARRNSMSQTIYNSPLGVSGQADVNRKTLLGQ